MSDIGKIAARPAAYLSETGVPQLIGGLFFFLCGACELVTSVLPKNSLAQEGPKWLVVLVCIAVAPLSRTIYRKFVFPRGGYVELRQRKLWGVPMAAAIGAVFGVSAGVLIWCWQAHLEDRLMFPAFAILWAGIFLAKSAREKSAAEAWFGVYLLVLAPVLWWIPAGNFDRSMWLFVALGLPMAVFGAIRLRNFVKAHPLAEWSAHE